VAKVSTEAISVYGAKTIYQHLSAMQTEVEGVMTSVDIEYIHRMRVATRRLRSSLAIFRDSFPKKDYKQFLKDIRAVTKALGAARDLDVQLELLQQLHPQFSNPRLAPGVNRLQLRLKQQRQEAQLQVIKAMKNLEDDETLRRIARWAAPWLEKVESIYLYSPALFELAFSSIKARLQELLVFDESVRIETNVAELHAMRISAKHLRYTMEAFDSLYGDEIKPFINQTKKLQDLLGSIHDADVWTEMIPTFIKEEEQRITTYFGHNRSLRRLLPGLKAFVDNRKLSRAEDYQVFIQMWDKTLQEGMWDNLDALINAPLNIGEAIKLLQRMEKPDEPETESAAPLDE
jgi:CHAD domain-containing protein